MQTSRIKTLILLIFLPIVGFSQIELSQDQLADYTSRANNQIRVFLENVPVIASGNQSKKLRQAAAKSTLSIFSSEAFIQEQNKFTKKKKNWSPKDYLKVLTERSDRAPILIDFEIIDDLAPHKMKKKKNKDGSISYIGKMKFRQYYCKLKDSEQLSEPTVRNPNANCIYSDTTDKEVKFELTVRESITGKYWVTKIQSIEVKRVF